MTMTDWVEELDAPPFCDKSEPARSQIVPVGDGFGFVRLFNDKIELILATSMTFERLRSPLALPICESRFLHQWNFHFLSGQ